MIYLQSSDGAYYTAVTWPSKKSDCTLEVEFEAAKTGVTVQLPRAGGAITANLNKVWCAAS